MGRNKRVGFSESERGGGGEVGCSSLTVMRLEVEEKLHNVQIENKKGQCKANLYQIGEDAVSCELFIGNLHTAYLI